MTDKTYVTNSLLLYPKLFTGLVITIILSIITTIIIRLIYGKLLLINVLFVLYLLLCVLFIKGLKNRLENRLVIKNDVLVLDEAKFDTMFGIKKLCHVIKYKDITSVTIVNPNKGIIINTENCSLLFGLPYHSVINNEIAAIIKAKLKQT